MCNEERLRRSENYVCVDIEQNNYNKALYVKQLRIMHVDKGYFVITVFSVTIITKT